MKTLQLLAYCNWVIPSPTMDGDFASCAILVTLTNGQVEVHLNVFTETLYTLKRITHVDENATTHHRTEKSPNLISKILTGKIGRVYWKRK